MQRTQNYIRKVKLKTIWNQKEGRGEIIPWPNNQSLRQITPSTMSGFKELWKASSTLPLTLNADSDTTVDSGTVKISCVSFESKGYRPWFILQYPRTSKTSTRGSLVSSKYISNSVLKTDPNSWLEY